MKVEQFKTMSYALDLTDTGVSSKEYGF